MPRESFGSRAGAQSDHLAADPVHYRKNTLSGPVASVEELCTALKEELGASADSSVPECTTSELSLRAHANLLLLRPSIGPYADGGEQDLPLEFKTLWAVPSQDTSGPSLPQATVDAVLSVSDARVRQIVQRAASRGIVQAIEAVDGFRYSFNNVWAAKDEDGLRFSYICQDSMQNKDRHANGFHKTLKHLKGDGDRGVRKPTYDCKGSISVKFSASRRCVYVYYRHYAIHSTVAERKPQPLPTPKHTLSGVGDGHVVDAPTNDGIGGLVESLQAQPSAYKAPSTTTARTQSSNIGRPLKRKRESEPAAPRQPHIPLSLAELLKQNLDAKKPAAAAQPPPKTMSNHQGDSIAYSLPSWQVPPPAVPPLPAAQRSSSTQGAATYLSPYPNPYPPSQIQQSQQLSAPSLSQSTSAPSQRSSQSQQQLHLGQPAHHPQSKSLFSMLKPVRVEQWNTHPQSLQPYVIHQSPHRAKTSCTSCRTSKKKCDEGRPICSACNRSGKMDCVYEGASFAPPRQRQQIHHDPQQQPDHSQSHLQEYRQPSRQVSHTSHVTSQAMRDENPHAWYPKR